MLQLTKCKQHDKKPPKGGFFIITLLVVLVSCITTKEGVKLLQCESMKWTAGVPQGGTGTEYYFTLLIKTTDPVQIDSVWLNTSAAFKIFKPGIAKGKIFYGTRAELHKNDTITLRFAEHIPGEVIPDDAPVKQIIPPFVFKEKALVRYYINGKPFYVKINSIIEKPAQYRP